jgi:hypothetical protein
VDAQLFEAQLKTMYLIDQLKHGSPAAWGFIGDTAMRERTASVRQQNGTQQGQQTTKRNQKGNMRNVSMKNFWTIVWRVLARGEIPLMGGLMFGRSVVYGEHVGAVATSCASNRW